ncbi:hypothetical protein D3C75_940490 [compost metagenome]
MAARRVRLAATINHYGDVAFFGLFKLIGIPQFDNQIAAAAIDNVLAFAPVKMHRRDLAVANMHYFFGITLGIRRAIG